MQETRCLVLGDFDIPKAIEEILSIGRIMEVSDVDGESGPLDVGDGGEYEKSREPPRLAALGPCLSMSSCWPAGGGPCG